MKTENIKFTPQWSKSKDDIWNETFESLNEKETEKHSLQKRIFWWQYAAAIILVVALSGTLTAFLYQTTKITARGIHSAIVLPDGSKVNLNAESELKYKPYWWFVSRQVELKGEAFFEVERGNRFTVRSNQNEVKVLGTSFDVFARPELYSVSCLTGKVGVTVNKETVVLNPDMRATFRNNKLIVEENIRASQTTEWIKDRFVFVGVPLVDVILEIERQYDIHITTNSSTDYLYTGNFSKVKDPKEILTIIGKPFGIKFSLSSK